MFAAPGLVGISTRFWTALVIIVCSLFVNLQPLAPQEADKLCAGKWCDGPPPFRLPPGVRVLKNIVYASPGGRPLRLDLFLPETTEGKHPVIVYIHGGGWVGGDKYHFYRQAAYMASEGFAGACIEYRLSGEAKFPAAVDDAKAAVRWLRAHADEYGLDTSAIGAAGGSAGGHLAAMLGTTGHLGSLADTSPTFETSSSVQAVAAFNPVLDLARIQNDLPQRFIGVPFADEPELWLFASPPSHVEPNSAPFLLLHGTEDDQAPYQHSVDMTFLLERMGVHAELFTAEGASHGFFNLSPWFEPALKRMEDFFRHTLMEPRDASD